MMTVIRVWLGLLDSSSESIIDTYAQRHPIQNQSRKWKKGEQLGVYSPTATSSTTLAIPHKMVTGGVLSPGCTISGMNK
jgi:hypothetical protein